MFVCECTHTYSTLCVLLCHCLFIHLCVPVFVQDEDHDEEDLAGLQSLSTEQLISLTGKERKVRMKYKKKYNEVSEERTV